MIETDLYNVIGPHISIHHDAALAGSYTDLQIKAIASGVVEYLIGEGLLDPGGEACEQEKYQEEPIELTSTVVMRELIEKIEELTKCFERTEKECVDESFEQQ